MVNEQVRETCLDHSHYTPSSICKYYWIARNKLIRRLTVHQVAGIAAGVYIWWGGKKTKRNEAVEERLRNALAMEKPRPGIGNPVIKVTADGESTEPTTVGSTPIMPQNEPHCQDFALSDSTVTASKDALDKKELPPVPASQTATPHMSPRIESVASIPISDSMTVPPASMLHNGVMMR